MRILHIAAINDNPCTGVPVAVPQHLKAQKEFADIALLNLLPYQIEGVDKCFIGENYSTIDTLPDGFSQPDLAVFHEVYYTKFIKIASDLKKRNIPYIIIPHGSLTKEAQNKKRAKKIIGNLLLFSKFIRGAIAIQYLSNKECERSNFGKNKFVEPNGITLPLEYKKYPSNKDLIQLVYIGNLSISIKGLDLLLEALNKVKALVSKKHLRLDIYGPNTGTRHEDIRQLISQFELEDIVFLHDAVIGEEKKRILLSADAFIQTSRSEGLSMGILEALSYGIPCIVTQGTNLREVIEENNAGWGADNTSESICLAITRFIDSENILKEKSRNAVQLIKSEYEWSVVAKKTIKKYTAFSDNNLL